MAQMICGWRAAMVALGIFTAGLPSATNAEAVAYPLSVTIASNGTAQDQLAYVIREELKASRTFRVVNSGDAGFRLRIAMMDSPSKDFIIYSFAFNFVLREADGEDAEYYLDAIPGYCGLSRFQSCATTIAARASEEAERLMDVVSQK